MVQSPGVPGDWRLYSIQDFREWFMAKSAQQNFKEQGIAQHSGFLGTSEQSG